jgi:membrane-associated HD superfamily phosphohydrolase
MLGDAVEASSRTLKDPSPMLLRRHIDTIIKGIYADGQLDDADLTFKDLTSLAESFHRMLRGIFHHRIAYPVRTDKRSDQGAAAVEDPATLSDKTPHSSLPQ